MSRYTNLTHRTRMRNGHKPATWQIAVALLACGFLSGCAGRGGARNPRAHADAPTPAASQVSLDAGYQALESQQYNEAIAKADEFLSGTPRGPGSAEALYLKGRGLEGKNAVGVVSIDEAKANLQEARAAYIEALEQNPKQPLESYIHA